MSLKPSKEPLPFLSGQTIPGGLPMFLKFSYKETKKATNNFSTVVGQGGFATVYKAHHHFAIWWLLCGNA
ncbi:hypothetical protein Nepgr_005148 [Nepenthes gracilis]|uniref:Uncharacterized protein n=1 Tax=Nepenthes gracilis TaxID=150966 RepID=A0AAD3S340_NEPGR|nr:hypothetical protein Nepgr_005148 [Nepenthes gracilis]